MARAKSEFTGMCSIMRIHRPTLQSTLIGIRAICPVSMNASGSITTCPGSMLGGGFGSWSSLRSLFCDGYISPLADTGHEAVVPGVTYQILTTNNF